MRRGESGPPALRPWLQHALLAGPTLGALATMHAYSLSIHSPTTVDRATGHVIAQTRMWHGRSIATYYITPSEHLLQECLAFPVGCWMISVIAGLVWSGIRVDLERRRDRQGRNRRRDR